MYDGNEKNCKMTIKNYDERACEIVTEEGVFAVDKGSGQVRSVQARARRCRLRLLWLLLRWLLLQRFRLRQVRGQALRQDLP